MDEPEVAADLAEIAEENAEIEADESADQGEDEPAYVFIKRRTVHAAAPR